MGRGSRRQGAVGALVAALAVLVLVAGCGAAGTEVETAQSGPDPEVPVAPTTGPTPTSDPAEPTTSPSTTVVVAPDDDPGASLVDGLDARTLQEAVTTPPSARARGATGPVAEAVTLSDGTVVWRVRIPGPFPARDARAVVAVDGGDVGWAASPPAGDALVAVAATAEGLVAGAEVTYRWGRADPVSAGPLVVVG